MFCLGAGCEVCTKPVKKASIRKPRKSVTTENTAPVGDASTAGVTAKPDIKAAMKAVATAKAQEVQEDERELFEALVALEPILHPDELAGIRNELDSYKPRRDRWRSRREQRG
jgi:hypothetical protein